MKKLITLFSILLLTVYLNNILATNVDSEIYVGGVKYPLAIAIPSDYDAQKSYPLIIGLHFCGGSASGYRSGLSPLCDSLDVIVVCPYNSSGQITNSNIITIAIDSAKSMYNINSQAVYLTGMSCNGFATLQMGLKSIYPFKGIFPWAPYMSAFNSSTFNLDSEVPSVISIGTLDESYSTAIKLYDSLRTHESDVNLVLVEGIGHTMSFNTFSNEMIRCYRYLNDNNAISIDAYNDFSILNTDSLEIKLKISHNTGKNLIIRAISSLAVIVNNPKITFSPSSDTVTFKILTKPNKSGKVFIVIEAAEENGSAIEQRVIKVTVTRPGTSTVIENSSDDFEIYPVPAKNQLFIKSDIQNLSVNVISLSGQIVLKQSLISTSEPINISGLNKGIYIIQVKSEELNVSRKIFVE